MTLGSLEAQGVAVAGAFFEIMALLLIPLVLVRRKEPSSTIAWILTLVFLPAVGASLFLLFGRDRVRWPAQRKREMDARVRANVAALAPQPKAEEEAAMVLAASGGSDLASGLFKVGALLTHGRPSLGNKVDVLFGGNDTYAALGAAIDGARHHIHAEYYLIRDDATGAWFRDRLAAAASRGVEVRLLIDGFGSFFLPSAWSRPIKKAGGRVSQFLPMRAVAFQPVNLRNHRKIVIVDGDVAFTGGINIGDEYRGNMPGLGEWRDIHMRIEGTGASDLQRVFFQDWSFATGEDLPPAAYFPEHLHEPGAAALAIVPSGPDTRTEAIQRIFFGAIVGAQHHVYITTPYFVPDDAILVALELAAMRGIDVRLILPSRSNHGVTFHAGRSFYEPLLDAGVKIFEYQPGMVHAKTMAVDGHVALVGSANMDLRSFRLNFEVHALVQDETTARTLEADFANELTRCARIDLDAWKKRGRRYRVLEGASRLVSPLL